MHVNPLPFVFAPGVILAGYLIAGAGGALIGLSGWAALVAAATCLSWCMTSDAPFRWRRPHHS